MEANDIKMVKKKKGRMKKRKKRWRKEKEIEEM